MKKTFLIILILITATHLFAQKDADAKTNLSKVSAKYRTYDVVKTDFYFTLENKQAGMRVTQSGTLIAKSKTNKFHVTMFGPEQAAKPIVEQEIISDGKTQWTY